MAVRYTVSIESRRLLDAFRRECRRRGRSQAFVVSGAMRYFVEHPHANGWGGGGEEEKKKREK